MYEYKGAIHIHSNYSDGTGNIEDIAKAASEAGLDYIIMTDHNTLKPKEDGYERWINGVMVLIGYEVNDMNNKNHYLTLGVDEVIGTYQILSNGELGCKLGAGEYVKMINEKGGIGFTAHPDEERNESYPWTEWDIDEFTGIEIWNHMSEWAEGITNQNKLNRFIHPLRTISAPQKKTLERWDEIAKRRRVTGIGGVDAHAFKENLLGLFKVEVFGYKVLFKSIRTHILLDSPIDANSNGNFHCHKQNILKALEESRCFVANYYHGDASGFRFIAEHNGKLFNMGETVKKFKGEDSKLKVSVPEKCEVRLVQNGTIVDTFFCNQKEWNITNSGVYRIECWKKDRGWIFSNHIRIVDEN
jgi:PHP domain-containing protein